MKFLTVGAGILLLSFVFIGAATTHGPVSDNGTIILSPLNNSGINGTASLTQGSQTYVFVRATNLASGAVYGVALMAPHCDNMQQLLNPITADLGGDGASSSQVDANAVGWIGILRSNAPYAAVVACGPAPGRGSEDGSATPIPSMQPTSPPATLPVGGGTVIPVMTPTHVPTPLPGGTPHPPGS